MAISKVRPAGGGMGLLASPAEQLSDNVWAAQVRSNVTRRFMFTSCLQTKAGKGA